jgi:ribosomal protein S18 acetylase RimI-like enzyme
MSVRVRLAVDEDKSSVASFLRQAMDMAPTEDPGFVPTVCPSILAALDGGHSAFVEVLFREFQEAPSHGHVAFSLVAQDSSGVVVGAIVCAPPYKFIEDCASAFPAQAQQTMLRGVVGLSKLVGVAVREDFRGCGVGTELVWIAQQILQLCGIFLMYGNCSSDLTPFYERLGFTIEPFETPLDLGPVLGVPGGLATPGMHVFSQRLIN